MVKKYDKEDISPCPKCYCMTKSIRLGRAKYKYKCGKCGADKSLSDVFFYEATHKDEVKPKMKLKIPEKITDYWGSYKHKFNPTPKNYYDENIFPIIGKLWWVIPEEVLWLYATYNEEGYDGSQTQFGIKKDGTIVWGFFSHCSCYGYEDYKGEFTELAEENMIHTKKTYELENVDFEVLEIIKKRIKDISKVGLKEIQRGGKK